MLLDCFNTGVSSKVLYCLDRQFLHPVGKTASPQIMQRKMDFSHGYEPEDQLVIARFSLGVIFINNLFLSTCSAKRVTHIYNHSDTIVSMKINFDIAWDEFWHNRGNLFLKQSIRIFADFHRSDERLTIADHPGWGEIITKAFTNFLSATASNALLMSCKGNGCARSSQCSALRRPLRIKDTTRP